MRGLHRRLGNGRALGLDRRAADQRFVALEADVELRFEPVHHALRFADDLDADAVPGKDQDPVRCHRGITHASTPWSRQRARERPRDCRC